MIYSLPKAVQICGAEYDIRWDYRPILDICAALSDPDLSDEERAYAALDIFYPDFDEMPQERYQEAVRQCLWFVNCGEEPENRKSPRLIDWEQDFPLIANPINRVLGREIREDAPLHWFTFMSAYQEIGDCTFAQVVRTRDKRARGKPLDKSEREWYRRNQQLVDFKRKYTSADEALMKEWGGV